MHEKHLDGLKERAEDEDPRAARDACAGYINICHHVGKMDDLCYVYAKKMVGLHISDVDSQDFGYDFILVRKISEIIKKFPVEQQLSLFQYFRRKLIEAEYRDEADVVNDSLTSAKIYADIRSARPLRISRGVLNWFTLSFGHLLLFFLIVFFLSCLVLSPLTPFSRSSFSIEYSPFSQNPIVNHVVNVAAALLDVEGSKVRSENLTGILILLSAKILSVIFVSNFFFQQLANRVNRQ